MQCDDDDGPAVCSASGDVFVSECHLRRAACIDGKEAKLVPCVEETERRR